MKITFYVQHLYYWPHFEPVIEVAKKEHISVSVIFEQQPNKVIMNYLNNNDVAYKGTNEKENSIEALKLEKSDWYFFGNAFEQADTLNEFSKTALIQHGIGPKSVYYTVSESPISYRFVESKYRLKSLQKKFPNKKFELTGYTKLDPIINGFDPKINIKEIGLDTNKKTILYAPTFYPSTIENFAKNWPADFEEYNIIIKPHFFSYVKKIYKKQRKLLEYWSSFKNVHLVPIEEQSLVPYMDVSDILVSEASSSMFEFAALEKPIIICEFVKLRWSYKGLFKFRLASRMDDDFAKYKSIAAIAQEYRELKYLLEKHISEPDLKHSEREIFSKELVGEVDGLAAKRVINFILSRQS